MASGSGQPPVPVSGSYDIADSLDPSTLLQLQNLQVISPNQSASREQPKGTDFLDIANRVSHVLPFSILSTSFPNHTAYNDCMKYFYALIRKYIQQNLPVRSNLLKKQSFVQGFVITLSKCAFIPYQWKINIQVSRFAISYPKVSCENKQNPFLINSR